MSASLGIDCSPAAWLPRITIIPILPSRSPADHFAKYPRDGLNFTDVQAISIVGCRKKKKQNKKRQKWRRDTRIARYGGSFFNSSASYTLLRCSSRECFIVYRLNHPRTTVLSHPPPRRPPTRIYPHPCVILTRVPPIFRRIFRKTYSRRSAALFFCSSLIATIP